MLAHGIREGLLFARREGKPSRLHKYQNWRRRTWYTPRNRAGVQSLVPYDLRHAFASPQIRAGMSISEFAEHGPLATDDGDVWWTSTRLGGARR
jgi:integrase